MGRPLPHRASNRYRDIRVRRPPWPTELATHVLPKCFHRIRHYGLRANGDRAHFIAKARDRLAMAPRKPEPEGLRPPSLTQRDRSPAVVHDVAAG